MATLIETCGLVRATNSKESGLVRRLEVKNLPAEKGGQEVKAGDTRSFMEKVDRLGSPGWHANSSEDTVFVNNRA